MTVHIRPFVRGVCFVALTVTMATARLSAVPQEAQPGKPNTKDPAESTPAQPTARTAADELAAVEKLYAGLKTYQDEGDVVVTTEDHTPPKTTTKSFASLFERDGKYAWNQQSNERTLGLMKFTMWTEDQKRFESVHTLLGNKSLPSLAEAVKTAHAHSDAASSITLTLLRPDVDGPARVTKLEKAELLKSESLGGVECAVVKDHQAKELTVDGATITLWVGADHAIRKVCIETTLDAAKIAAAGHSVQGKPAQYKASTTATLRPRLNEALPQKKEEPPPK